MWTVHGKEDEKEAVQAQTELATPETEGEFNHLLEARQQLLQESAVQHSASEAMARLFS